MTKDTIITLARMYRNIPLGSNPLEIADAIYCHVNYFKDNNCQLPDAYVDRTGKRIIIQIRDSLSDKAKEAVCAHELGHILLGHIVAKNYAGLTSNPLSRQDEREANLFAVALLFDEDVSLLKRMDDYQLKCKLESYYRARGRWRVDK